MRRQGCRRLLQGLGCLWCVTSLGCLSLPCWSGGAAKDHLQQPTPPPTPVHAPANEMNNEYISLVSQKLAATEDDRKVLSGRLQQMESQLDTKDKALNDALNEIAAARDAMARSRLEAQRWKQEKETLRERMNKLEKENITTLEAVIKMLERQFESEKDFGPEMPKPPAPE